MKRNYDLMPIILYQNHNHNIKLKHSHKLTHKKDQIRTHFKSSYFTNIWCSWYNAWTKGGGKRKWTYNIPSKDGDGIFYLVPRRHRPQPQPSKCVNRFLLHLILLHLKVLPVVQVAHGLQAVQSRRRRRYWNSQWRRGRGGGEGECGGGGGGAGLVGGERVVDAADSGVDGTADWAEHAAAAHGVAGGEVETGWEMWLCGANAYPLPMIFGGDRYYCKYLRRPSY